MTVHVGCGWGARTRHGYRAGVSDARSKLQSVLSSLSGVNRGGQSRGWACNRVDRAGGSIDGQGLRRIGSIVGYRNCLRASTDSEGAKVTEIEQLALGAMGVPTQGFDGLTNSDTFAPPKTTPETCSGAVPEFEITMFVELLAVP